MLPQSLLYLTLVLAGPAAAPGEDWELAKRKGELEIYSRRHDGTQLKEVLASGCIDVPPWVCKNVVDDVESFPEFMPYTVDSRIVARDGEDLIVYQRLDAPMIADRDWVMRTRNESRRREDGVIEYKKTWRSAEGHGPEPSEGVVRILVNQGCWIFEPRAKGEGTRVTYRVFTDPGGRIPNWMVNRANTKAIPKLFAAVAERALERQYWERRPALPETAE